ncbi:hypothetical protein [Solimicrobium silvestre]|uniref:Uncharacterized protein n=1 Tax=Solimicrobium silvestre TaxID=2099400 RepID=A0A2S9H1L7_9BURK|nr:hypothetical protein [Solimicrobium silvestre]PRC93881.1 hypothetical protein S2091_1490 [Solimicrobium silvestre]
MIHQLAESYLSSQAGRDDAVLTSLDQLLVNDTDGKEKDDNIDQLYEQLKKCWEANPDIRSEQIIDYLRKFVAADGSMPYKSIPTHTAALGQVMARFKEDGGADSPIYSALYKGLGFAVVSNGILNSFIRKMTERPEEPEPW